MGTCQCCQHESYKDENDQLIFINLFEVTNDAIVRNIQDYNWRRITYNTNAQINALSRANEIFKDPHYKSSRSAYMIKWKRYRYKINMGHLTQLKVLDDVLFDIFSRNISY